jgi:heme-degrading monooxygenase HmoA
MFCVIYEFEVLPNNEEEFKGIWHSLTLLFREHYGAIGSCLHKDMNEKNLWIAYARWPSKEAWQKRFTKLVEQQAELGDRMQQLCVKSRTAYTMELSDDLLLGA